MSSVTRVVIAGFIAVFVFASHTGIAQAGGYCGDASASPAEGQVPGGQVNVLVENLQPGTNTLLFSMDGIDLGAWGTTQDTLAVSITIPGTSIPGPNGIAYEVQNSEIPVSAFCGIPYDVLFFTVTIPGTIATTTTTTPATTAPPATAAPATTLGTTTVAGTAMTAEPPTSLGSEDQNAAATTISVGTPDQSTPPSTVITASPADGDGGNGAFTGFLTGIAFAGALVGAWALGRRQQAGRS